MDENINKSNIKMEYIVIGVTVILIIAVIIMLFTFNRQEEPSKMYETEQVTAYSNKIEETLEEVKDMQLEEAKSYVTTQVYKANEEFGGIDEVDYMSNQVLTTTLTDTSTTIDEYIVNIKEELKNTKDKLNDGIDKLLNSDDKNVLKSSITIRSNTVCDDKTIDNKYCVDKLNAKVYITDVTSNNWAVIVHGHMMSGSLMYKAIGNMYTEKGYNVIAPDLRGFGSSAGSVAMGYLESLDIYDWIKDLNQNWNQKERYGVTVAPETIVVHGISLGGATTLQLATNPDIQSSTKAPYTKNLTELHVKGFIDDCGYTSMSGIITDMISLEKTVELTSLLSSLNIELDDFMIEISKITKNESIPGFESIEILEPGNMDFKTIYSNLNHLRDSFNELQDSLNQYINNNGNYEIPGMDKDTINNVLKEYSGYIEDSDVKDKAEDIVKDAMGNINIPGLFNGIGKNIENNIVKVSTTKKSENVLEGLVAKALMNLVGVGLTEENYSKYSNVFSDGRAFLSGSKVMVIHGTLDTTVPHSNADTVEKNISPANLVHKWDAINQPHAFIVIGSQKEEYKTKVSKYLDCVEDNTCILF